MPKFMGLLHNEVEKIILKKRFLVTILISLVLIIMMTLVGHVNQKSSNVDWKQEAQTQIQQNQKVIQDNHNNDETVRRMQLQNQKLQYHLDHNIPIADNTAVNLVMDWTQSEFISTFIPLLITIVAADLVSSELTDGTIKLLLTRPARRWKVLASKFIALQCIILLLFVFLAVVSYLVYGAFLSFGSWEEPIILDVQQGNAGLGLADVRLVPAWQATLIFYGLAFVSTFCFSTIPFLVSVLFRSSATSMGITMAGLIGGSIVAQLASFWKPLKYFFMAHLDLSSHLLGSFPLDPQMSLTTSVLILVVWAALALVCAFTYFNNRDISV